MEQQPSPADIPGRIWRRIRGWLPELAIFVVVIAGVHLYGTQDMLNAAGEPAPNLYLPSLAGGQSGLPPDYGKTTLVYFFAPWCTWCAASAHNIRKLRDIRGEEELTVFLVDMDRDFAAFNEVYREYFDEIRPTRTTVAVRALPTPIAVELKVLAKAR